MASDNRLSPSTKRATSNRDVAMTTHTTLESSPPSTSSPFQGGEVPLIQSPTARRIERALDVTLPSEFSRICEYCKNGGVSTSVTDRYGAEQDATSLIGRTLQYRNEMGLPEHYIVLGSTDYSVVLLRCLDRPSGTGKVYAVPLASLAAFNLGQSPAGVRTWPSFADYFARVLERRARDR